MGEYIGFPKL